jgi:hypothetical protein
MGLPRECEESDHVLISDHENVLLLFASFSGEEGGKATNRELRFA